MSTPIKAKLVLLHHELTGEPISPYVSSQGVIMSDNSTLETYIDNHIDSSKVLSHSLTIGTQVFDGSVDVVVPVYDGDVDNLLSDSMDMQMQNTNSEMRMLTRSNMQMVDTSSQMRMI